MTRKRLGSSGKWCYQCTRGSSEESGRCLDFSANGNFIPKKELNFLSENAGRITKIYVEKVTVYTKDKF